MLDTIAKKLINDKNLKILGPAPAPIMRKNNRYIYQLIIQSNNRKLLLLKSSQIREYMVDNKKYDIRWSLDIDPIDLYQDDKLKEIIIEKLTDIVINKFGNEYASLIEVSRVTKPHIDADFYSNIAMKLAKFLKQNPTNIAKDITEAIMELDGISVSVAKPGYINFQINKNLKNNLVYEIVMTDDLLASFKVENPKNKAAPI